jgi:hypothetical protein
LTRSIAIRLVRILRTTFAMAVAMLRIPSMQACRSAEQTP